MQAAASGVVQCTSTCTLYRQLVSAASSCDPPLSRSYLCVNVHACLQALPDARSMARSRGDNGGATIVYIGTRERSEVPI